MHERSAALKWMMIILCIGALSLSSVVATSTTPSPSPKQVTAREEGPNQPTLFPRTVAWWPYTSGPHYGDLPLASMRDNNVLRTAVGSFRIGEDLALPADLTGNLSGLATGAKQYFLAQLRPSALAQPFAETLASQGAEIVGQVPVNGLILRMDQAAYGLVSSSPLLQFLEPYHPAYRIAPTVGTAWATTPEKAASPIFDLQINLFPGEALQPVVQRLTQLGATVTSATMGSRGVVKVQANASLIPQIARIEAISSIADDAPVFLHSDSALNHQSRTADLGDFTYWIVGLDGDGQRIHVTDSGLSVDAADFADTSADSGWTGGTGCHVLADHRKVICYRTAADFGGGGDLSSCDTSADNGGQGTHGQVSSGVATGNATRGAVPTSAAPSPTDDPNDPNKTWVRDFGAGFYTDADNNGQFSELRDTAFDGVAKGARVVFYDATSGCPESGGISAGNAFQNVVTPWNDYDANIHNFSFGSTPAPNTDPLYTTGASDYDDAIFQNPINFVTVSAGNEGAKETSGTSASPGNISNEASCKNCVPVGASAGPASFVWSFSSEGPSAGSRLRVAPLLMAEGSDYACFGPEEGPGVPENQTGAAGCTQQSSSGTSFSAPSLAGTAAIVGEYLAEGFYPDGTDQNASNSADKVAAVSSALTKAILIAGAQPLPAGSRGIADGRFNNVWGYGMVQLQNSLPLADDPDTPAGMILHDLPGDIDKNPGDDGVSHLSLPATIGTTPGGTGAAEFEVLATDEDLAVVLVWHDPPTADGTVDNNLDLEVRYCGADGTCGNADDTVYTGNAFSEFPDRDPSTFNDLDSDGSADGYNYSIPEHMVTDAGFSYADWKDPENNTEAVYVPGEFSDYPKTPGGNPYLPLLQAGTWSVEVIRVDGTTNNLPFSIAIVGPVAAGSSVRFDTNPVSCNADENVIVTEVDDAADPSCPDSATCTPSVVSSRTTVRVYDETDTLVDTETNLTFEQPDANVFKYQTASPLPLSIHGTATDNDGILTVNHDYRLEVTYNDDSGGLTERVSNARVDCQPDMDVSLVRQIGPDYPFLLIGGCDDDNYLDQNESFSLSVSFFNLDLVDLIDATVSLDVCQHRANPTPDNCVPVTYVTVYDTQQKLGLLPAQTQQLSRFNFAVTGTPPGRDMVDLDVCLAGEKTGQQVADCTTFTVLAQADDDEHFYITDCPTGCANVRYDLNNDEKWESSIARNPFDPLDFIRRGRSEIVDFENMVAAGDEDNNGTPDCEENGNSYTCGNPGFSGPWTFDVDDEGFRTGVNSQSKATGGLLISNWGEDENFDGVFDAAEDKNGNFVLDQNWSTTGGCGWMANDDGGSGPGGIWHTGHIGSWNSSHDTGTACRGQTEENATNCEEYDAQAGTEGNELWFELLRTPEIHPVHFGSHPDGFDWRTQITDWSWVAQWDQADDTLWTWEFDLDVAGNEVLLGDTQIHGGIFGNATGAINGGQLNIFDGAHLFGPTDDDPASSNYGNQAFTSKGGNRDGRRGCYFNDLDTIIVDDNGTADPADDFTAAEYDEALPRPTDDDCDNDFDLGPDGCPGECGVDDDGNGLIDDLGDSCPCTTCDGGPRAGASCFSHSACNPSGGLVYRCTPHTDANGVPLKPINAGAGWDDTCGDGQTDEGVFAAFSTDAASDGTFKYHSERPMGPELVNGIARGGRGAGKFEFNTLEDFYFPVGDTWQAEVGFAVFEASGDPAVASYGLGIDNMVVEWKEVHPIDQAQDNCSTASPYNFEGRCAVVALGETANTFDGDGEVSVSVTDPVPDGNLIDCDGDGELEVEINVFSEAERTGETLCLDRLEPGADHFVGTIKTTTATANAGDGLLYLAFNGLDTPSITARYVDQNDGVHDANGANRYGPDGQPGIAGFDDDGDGIVDNASEHCPTTSSLAPGRTPHESGQPPRFSDDDCGCLDNPITDSTFASFDIADVIIGQIEVTDDGDGDGFADPGEIVTINVQVRNLADFALEDVKLRLGTESDKVECLTDDLIEIDRLEARGTTGSDVFSGDIGDAFTFKAAAVTRPAGDTGTDFASTFTVTLQALGRATPGSNGSGSRRFPGDTDKFDIPVFGTAVVQQFKVVHNLDVTEGGAPSTFTDDFESYANDTALFANWTTHNTGDDPAELDGTRCQYNDPANPFGNNTDPADFCELGEGYSNSANEWHLESITGCTSQGVAGCPATDDVFLGGAKSINPGAPSNGTNSLALSFVNYSPEPFDDNHSTYMNRMRWIETANSIQLGLGNPELSYWTQMSILDGRLFVGLDHPDAFDAGLTYICVDDNGNNECDTLETGDLSGSERWEPLRAYLNTEQSWRFPNFINCMYEPSDDGSNEDDFFNNSVDLGPSSTCFPNLSDTCVGRTRKDSDFSAILGSTLVFLSDNCFPETGEIDSEVAGIYEVGAGPGIWAHKKYDLTPWQGRQVLIRFHASPGGLPGFDFCADTFVCGNRDDGWYIDMFEITGTRSAPSTVSVDNATHGTGATCPTNNCTTATARAAVLPYPRNDKNSQPKPALACTDTAAQYCDFDRDGVSDASSSTALSGAGGHAVFLDASKSATDTCFGGAIEYRFETGGTVVRDWLTDPTVLVNPVYTTTYDVLVRCSSTPSCQDSVQVTVDTGNTQVTDCYATGLVFSANKTDFSWTADANAGCDGTGYDTSKGDVASLPGSFSGSCFHGNLATTSDSDPANPAAGSATWYLARHDQYSWNNQADPSQQGDRDPSIGDCQ
ncbi:MAG: hypothetical protein Q9Q40_10800 [Acidobacteriota bacterium]|nr:hypothetical protein [Acidobacteriota bacterium]